MKKHKAFIACGIPKSMRLKLDALTDTELDHLDRFVTQDPSGSEWRKLGLIPGRDDVLISKIDGRGHLMNVQFNERILPGAVINEATKARVDEIGERQGFKVGRKEFAQIKEEVTFDLLPKAFIKRSTVPVMILSVAGLDHDLLLVFTGSPKKFDDTLALLSGAFNNWAECSPWLLLSRESPTRTLTDLAQNPEADFSGFTAGSAAILKGADKETIRIKDQDIYSTEIEYLLNDGYQVHELALEFLPAEQGATAIEFTFNEKLIFKKLAIPTTKDADTEADQSTDWIVATECSNLVVRFFAQMGGIAPRKAQEKSNAPAGAKARTTPDEDDEL